MTLRTVGVYGLSLVAMMFCLALPPLANADAGDAASVSQARKDYAEAMKGGDRGLQNATRVALHYQLAKARERARNQKRGLARENLAAAGG